LLLRFGRTVTAAGTTVGTTVTGAAHAASAG